MPSILVQKLDMGLPKKHCEICGQELFIRCRAVYESRKCCSRHCLGVYNRQRGKIKPRGSDEFKSVIKHCFICGKKLVLLRSSDIEHKKYCSRACLGISKRGKKQTRKRSPINGIDNPFFGKSHTIEVKQRLSLLAKQRRGTKNPNWHGGSSNMPYAFDFDEELKELIRKRDNYKCQMCGCPEIECKNKLSVHHIDYDKMNSNPPNLISLCKYCHSKTNGKRDKWHTFLEKYNAKRVDSTA